MSIIFNDQVIAGSASGGEGIPPSECLNLEMTKLSSTKVSFKWADPGNTVISGKTLCTWRGTKLVKKLGSFPLSPDDGVVVVDSQIKDHFRYNPLIVEGLGASEYYYKLFPYSDHYIYNLSNKNQFGAYDYAFVIDNSDGNPYTRVTYYEDSLSSNFTRAYMDFSNDQFVWGSHENAWWLPKPCMLHCGGAGSDEDYVDYYLNPNNYAEKLDGTASDYNNTSYSGNVMVEFPQIWTMYEFDPTDSNKFIIHLANKQISSQYTCYSHYNKDGDLVPYIYRGAYDGSYINSRTRCISNQTPGNSQIVSTEISYAQANGDYWFIDDLSTRLMISNLLTYMSLSTNSQGSFGNGFFSGGTSSNLLKSGLYDDKGLFWGVSTSGSTVKTLGIENLWGNLWLRTAGYINKQGTQLIKLTPNINDGSTATSYNLDGTGYLTLDSSYNLGVNNNVGGTYITSTALIPPYGIFPYGTYGNAGSATTYLCDGIYSNTSDTYYSLFGGSSNEATMACGLYAVQLANSSDTGNWSRGTSLVCKPKKS